MILQSQSSADYHYDHWLRQVISQLPHSWTRLFFPDSYWYDRARALFDSRSTVEWACVCLLEDHAYSTMPYGEHWG